MTKQAQDRTCAARIEPVVVHDTELCWTRIPRDKSVVLAEILGGILVLNLGEVTNAASVSSAHGTGFEISTSAAITCGDLAHQAPSNAGSTVGGTCVAPVFVLRSLTRVIPPALPCA